MNKLFLVIKANILNEYFFNTLWMLFEKIFKMIVVLFVNILLARYLGPEKFGILMYSVSLVGLLSVATHMGLSGLVIKELVSYPQKTPEILGTVFLLKLLGAIVGFILLLFINFISENNCSVSSCVLLIISFSIFLKPFEVVDFWFIANVKAKYTTYVNTLALFITSVLKIILVYYSMNLLWFANVELLQSVLIALFFIYSFFSIVPFSFSQLKFSLQEAKYLLSKSWIIMLGSFFAIIYLKIDQVMLKWLLDDKAVGIYSVAASLSEVWYFLPTVIVTSLFPKIISLKDEKSLSYNEKLQQLYDFLFILAFVIALIISFIGNDIVEYLYGKEYIASGEILIIHIWASIFIFLRALFSKWIILENVLIFSLITQGFGALSNILLNFILIPEYGLYGAAIATLISYAIASYVVLFFFDRTRNVFFMMTKAIFSPVRYILKGYTYNEKK